MGGLNELAAASIRAPASPPAGAGTSSDSALALHLVLVPANLWRLVQLQRTMRQPDGALPARMADTGVDRMRWIGRCANEMTDTLLTHGAGQSKQAVAELAERHARVLGIGAEQIAGASLRQLALPAITLAIFTLAPLARMSRAAMLQALSSDFVRTARAAGLEESQVVFGYAFRSAMLPVMALSSCPLRRAAPPTSLPSSTLTISGALTMAMIRALPTRKLIRTKATAIRSTTPWTAR